MINFVSKRWARVLCLVMCVFCLAVAAVADVVVQYGRADEWYNLGTDGFEDTTHCIVFASDGAWYVFRTAFWLGDWTLEGLGTYAGDAFSYVIKDADGNIYADTTSESSVYVTSANGAAYAGYDNTDVTVEGYVDLPVEPYGGCYAEYAIFEAFFGLRYLLMGAVILLDVVAVFCLVLAAWGFVLQGREGGLRRFQRLPADLVAVVCLLCAVLLCKYAVDNAYVWIERYFTSYYIYYSIFYYFTQRLEALVWILAALPFVCITAGQLGARCLYQRLLLRRVGGIWLLAAAIAGHIWFLCFMARRYMGAWVLYTGSSRAWIIGFVAYELLLVGVVLWIAREARAVKKASKALSGGDLQYKIETGKLHFIWRELGQALNSIGDGMAQAVEEQMRSERMKTELITNVSHDLKTPLTSIINYIGFLKEAELDPQAREEYLAVLERQSAKLKKLTEDVIEASKAASGAVSVTLEPLNAGELLEQSVGEYSARLQAAGIEPVVQIPEEEPVILADSALLGRVLENLLTNILKYAQPGTRAYFALEPAEERTVISAKNISSAPLNMSVEELLERFVRGDSSRHSEGSGLGLSIARSLTELMGGTLALTLDGDLFKAELSFARAAPERLPPPAEAEEELPAAAEE